MPGLPGIWPSIGDGVLEPSATAMCVISGRQARAQGRVGEQGDRPVGALGGVERVVIAGKEDELARPGIEFIQADAGVQGRADPARKDLGNHCISPRPGDLKMIEVHLVGGDELRHRVGRIGDRLGLNDGSSPMAPCT